MIESVTLMLRTRLAAKDTGKTRYDDFEIMTAVDAAVDELTSKLALFGSVELMRSAELETDESATAELPEDFFALVAVGPKGLSLDFHGNFDERDVPDMAYRIEGSRLRVSGEFASSALTLVYHKHPGHFADKEIDLDAAFIGALSQAANNYLDGEIDAAETKLEKAVIQARYSKRGPVYDRPLWSGQVSNR